MSAASPARSLASSSAAAQPADLVDETALLGVSSRPHPAASERVETIGWESTPFGDLRREVVVDAVQPGVEMVPIGVTERSQRREHQGMTSLGDVVVADAETLDQPPDHLLAGEHADRAGQRCRLGDDLVGAHRHEVATRGGDVSHRHDNRFAGLTGESDLAPDRIRGDV